MFFGRVSVPEWYLEDTPDTEMPVKFVSDVRSLSVYLPPLQVGYDKM